MENAAAKYNPIPASNAAHHTINPQTWPTDFKLVPVFRPLDRNLDQAERPYGANLLERVFISVMLAGVLMQSVSLVTQRAWPTLTLRITLLCSGKLPEPGGGHN